MWGAPDGGQTKYDLASLTKVLATTTATMKLYQSGYLELGACCRVRRRDKTADAKVTQYLGDEFGANGKAGITIRHLLTHSAGFPPDPVPGFSSPAFGCPQTKAGVAAPEVFTCMPKIRSALNSQSLQYPIGEQSVYSDLRCGGR